MIPSLEFGKAVMADRLTAARKRRRVRLPDFRLSDRFRPTAVPVPGPTCCTAVV